MKPCSGSNVLMCCYISASVFFGQSCKVEHGSSFERVNILKREVHFNSIAQH